MNDGRSITLLIVEDNDDLAEVLELSLRQQPDLSVVGRLSSADGLLETIAETHPDVVLMDLGMTGKPALEAVREVTTQCPDTRVVMYSGFDDEATVDCALDAGAWGFASKHRDFEDLVAVVRRVAGGEVATGTRE